MITLQEVGRNKSGTVVHWPNDATPAAQSPHQHCSRPVMKKIVSPPVSTAGFRVPQLLIKHTLLLIPNDWLKYFGYVSQMFKWI